MKKRTACFILSLCIALTLFLSLFSVAYAANYPVTGIITTEVWVRQNPNVSDGGIVHLSVDQEVIILDEVTAGGVDWYKIQCTVSGSAKTGYILTRYAERGYNVVVFDKSVKIEDILSNNTNKTNKIFFMTILF